MFKIHGIRRNLKKFFEINSNFYENENIRRRTVCIFSIIMMKRLKIVT